MVDEPLYKSLIDRYRVLMTDPSAAAQATGWFTQSAKQITGLSAAEIMGNPGDRKRLLPISKVDPRLTGRMVMFFYNPKHRDKLPHYDMFPMVIPIEFYPDGFLGLNLHYLPPSLRVRMLDQLYQIYKNRHLDEKKKLNIGYQMLKRSIRSRYFAPCVHRYLYTASNGGGIRCHGATPTTFLSLTTRLKPQPVPQYGHVVGMYFTSVKLPPTIADWLNQL